MQAEAVNKIHVHEDVHLDFSSHSIEAAAGAARLLPPLPPPPPKPLLPG